MFTDARGVETYSSVDEDNVLHLKQDGKVVISLPREALVEINALYARAYQMRKKTNEAS